MPVLTTRRFCPSEGCHGIIKQVANLPKVRKRRKRKLKGDRADLRGRKPSRRVN